MIIQSVNCRVLKKPYMLSAEGYKSVLFGHIIWDAKNE